MISTPAPSIRSVMLQRTAYLLGMFGLLSLFNCAPANWISSARAQGSVTSTVTSKPTANLPTAKAIEDAIAAQRVRSQEAVDRAGSMRNPQSLPSTGPMAPGGDIGKIVEQYGQFQTDIAAPPKAEGLVIFISLSMPSASLQRLIDQSARYGVPLVIRGLEKDSFKTTIAKIRALVGNTNAEIQIDPRLFDRFAINKVPAFTVIAPEGPSGTIYGDVTTAFALEAMERTMPRIAIAARSWLDKGVRK